MPRYLLIALLTLLASSMSAASATVVLDSSSTSPAVGGTVTVTFRVTDAPATTTWNQFLRFDKTKLELKSQATGTTGIFVPDSRSLADINASGEVRAGGFVLGTPVSGSLNLGVFTFQALATGNTTISTEGRSSTNLSANMLQGPAPERLLTVPVSTALIALNIGGTAPQREVGIRIHVSGVPIPGLGFTVSPSVGTTGSNVGTYKTFSGLNPVTPYTFTVVNPAPFVAPKANT